MADNNESSRCVSLAGMEPQERLVAPHEEGFISHDMPRRRESEEDSEESARGSARNNMYHDRAGEEDEKDDEDPYLFFDAEDHRAFGHWDTDHVEYVRLFKEYGSLCQTVDLTGIQRINQRGELHLNAVACRKLGEYMRQADMRRWILKDMGLPGDALHALFAAWGGGQASGLPRSGVKALDAGGNPALGSDEMGALSLFLRNNSGLELLELPGVGLTLRGSHTLAQEIAEQRHLMCLNLSENSLGDEAVKAFAEVLKSLDSLKKLDLRGNRIRRYCSVAPLMEHGAPCASSLTQLNLKHNLLDDMFLCELSHVMRENDSVEEIYVEGNDEISENGLTSLLRALVSPSSSVSETARANRCLRSIGWRIAFSQKFVNSPTMVHLERMLFINRLDLSRAQTAWQKVEECYPNSGIGERGMLDIDVKLAPHLLSSLGVELPGGLTSAYTKCLRLGMLYEVLRKWNVPALFGSW
ncbi:hypothetical protein ACHAWF_003464 [Thalassiosira exigua]